MMNGMETLIHHLYHFASWRKWGILYANPILKNSYIFFYMQLIATKEFAVFLIDTTLFILLTFAIFSYGYLLNDAADREKDAQHRTTNTFQYYSKKQSSTIVLLSTLPLALFGCYFHTYSAFFTPALIFWFILATGYSLPYIYLKGRGGWGLITVVLALRTIPGLLLLLTYDYTRDYFGSMLILVYLSLRGTGADLAHQILHHDEDTKNHDSTFSVRYGLEKSKKLLFKVLRVERFTLFILIVWMSITISGGVPHPVLIPLNIMFLTVSLFVLFVAEKKATKVDNDFNPHALRYTENTAVRLKK